MQIGVLSSYFVIFPFGLCILFMNLGTSISNNDVESFIKITIDNAFMSLKVVYSKILIFLLYVDTYFRLLAFFQYNQ